ncbi:MAG: phosphotransferase, partial [Pseudomonadota bacterium]|nr:phosphotransferase [Pseudomonadota bacterium]MEC8270393.1 phosphotransferase [Pseudomonadota bacterium]MEC8516619.1 phosphotransferase [Pseudomonadota bacterium]
HSDGRNSPADVVRLYRDAGYHFTCLSEHYWSNPRFCAATLNDASALDRDDFITLLSAELHCHGKLYDRDGLWHIVANGLPPGFAMAGETETGPELVSRAVAAGAYVTIAHPEWYSLTDAEAQALAEAGAHGVEIYNHASTIDAARGGGTATVDYLLHQGFPIHITATDDSHDIPRDAFGGWVMVAARDLTSDAILAALKAGDFYASTGPDILSITRDGTVIEIETSPVQRIILAADKHHAEPVAGDGITRARFDLKKFDPAFVRIVAIDARGRSAWSNPYWLG